MIIRTVEWDDPASVTLRRLVLETGDQQPDAIRFYEREGFTRIPNFGHYVDSELSLCYERVLQPELG